MIILITLDYFIVQYIELMYNFFKQLNGQYANPQSNGGIVSIGIGENCHVYLLTHSREKTLNPL